MIDFYKNFKACERIENEFFDKTDRTTMANNDRMVE